jgi:hypothetical protein
VNDLGMMKAHKVGFVPHAAIRPMNERRSRIAAAAFGCSDISGH